MALDTFAGVGARATQLADSFYDGGLEFAAVGAAEVESVAGEANGNYGRRDAIRRECSHRLRRIRTPRCKPRPGR